MPEAILFELGITSPADIDLPVIAYYLGATIKYSALDGCEARIIGMGDRAIIRVRKNAPRRRQRFSVAHELGHWQLHRGLNLVCGDAAFRPSLAERSAEAAANSFAGKLLLPTHLLAPIAKQHSTFDFKAIGGIAEQFDTSLTATTIRLLQARLAPLIMISYASFSRKWWKKSIDVRDDLIPPIEPHPETNAFRLLHSSGRTGSNARLVDSKLWFDRHDVVGMKVLEDSIKTADGDVLVILCPVDPGLLRNAS